MSATDGSDAAIVAGDEIWYLRLYVAGQSPKSLHAFANLKILCDEHLMGHYEIEIIDLVEHPSRALSDDVLAVPTLVRRLPKPLRKVIGDLSNTEQVLVGLRLEPAAAMATTHDPALQRFEDALAATHETPYEFTLFISGASDLSGRAIANARTLCDLHLSGRYQLAVVDLYEDPAAVLSSQVLATPTLVKNRPLPVRRFVGDLSHTAKVLLALGLAVDADAAGALA